MRMIVLSDSHGREKALEAVYRAQPSADYYLHLGDGYPEVCAMRAKHPDMPLLAVKGNTDFTCPEPEIKQIATPHGNLLFMHGHRFSVKSGLGDLIEYAKQSGVQFGLFGHTHVPFYERIDNIHFLNPGCAEQGGKYRFGIIDVTETDVVCVLASIDR